MGDTLRIGEAATMLAVTTETVRNYVRQGLLVAKITAKGHRRFNREDVERLRDHLPPKPPEQPKQEKKAEPTEEVKPSEWEEIIRELHKGDL